MPSAGTGSFTITANGESRVVETGTSVRALLDSLGLASSQVAVEHNGSILPRARYGETMLGEGDRVEIVTLVGGG